MSISNVPTFNLKVVLKETGIAADTLRAWERRYGLPMPERTPGGHRLYSQHDIEIIKWLIAKQKEGLSISRAVDLWNELTASSQDPLSAPVLETTVVHSLNLDTIRQQWLAAGLKFDESFSEQILNQAFAVHPIETVCVEVLQRGLIEVGEMWYHAQATVQQEHFISALAHRRLDALIAAAPPPTRSQTILIGCTSKEMHTFTPLLLSLFLRRLGLKVVYLGANVPIQRFNETLMSVKPRLVVLSAQQLNSANELRETAAYLNANGGRVAFGGRIFNQIPELRQRIPAHFLGETVQIAIQNIETLLTADIPLAGVIPPSEEDLALGKALARNRPAIDMYAMTEAIKMDIPIEYANIAIQQFGSNLVSAVSLGHIEALRAEMDWIDGLLREYNQNEKELEMFLSAYASAVDTAMGKAGQPISNWIIEHIKAEG